MADSTLNRFLAFETSAARTARTPIPPTPASGPGAGYWSVEQDGAGNPTGNVYTWSTAASAWVKVTSGGGGSTTPQSLINALLAEDPPGDEQWLLITPPQPSGVAAGAYTNTNLTVDSFGRVITASNGSGGGVPFPAYTGTTVPPALASFTWVNQAGGGTSATAVQGGGTGTPILMMIPNVAGLQWKGLFVAQPATPYTRTAWFQMIGPRTNATDAGLYFYDGTKLMGIEFLTLEPASGFPLVRVEKINNVTTDNSTVASIAAGQFRAGAIGLRINNSGTTLTFSWSFDGYNWTQLFSEAVGTFITPTQVGWGGVTVITSGQSGDQYLNLQSWGS